MKNLICSLCATCDNKTWLLDIYVPSYHVIRSLRCWDEKNVWCFVSTWGATLVTSNWGTFWWCSLFNLAELADRDSVFISRRELLNLAVSSTRADGNPVPGRAPKGEWKKNSESMDTEKKTSNKEEILALFKRIQSSISKGETIKSRNRNSKQAEDVSAESLLEVLHQSTRKGEVKMSLFHCVETIYLREKQFSFHFACATFDYINSVSWFLRTRMTA